MCIHIWILFVRAPSSSLPPHVVATVLQVYEVPPASSLPLCFGHFCHSPILLFHGKRLKPPSTVVFCVAIQDFLFCHFQLPLVVCLVDLQWKSFFHQRPPQPSCPFWSHHKVLDYLASPHFSALVSVETQFDKTFFLIMMALGMQLSHLYDSSRSLCGQPLSWMGVAGYFPSYVLGQDQAITSIHWAFSPRLRGVQPCPLHLFQHCITVWMPQHRPHVTVCSCRQ